jgi:hypothetical protein
MLEASAEVLIRLIKAFDHYEQKNQSRLAQALIVRTRSEPSNPCQKANPGHRLHDIALTAPSLVVSYRRRIRRMPFRLAGTAQYQRFPVGPPAGSDGCSS